MSFCASCVSHAGWTELERAPFSTVKDKSFGFPPPPSISVGRGSSGSRERSKDRAKNDEYIDVEKTPKKFQRTYANSGSKHSRGSAKGSASGANDRSEKLQRPGKRTVQTKWKRRGSEKEKDEPVTRKKKVIASQNLKLFSKNLN